MTDYRGSGPDEKRGGRQKRTLNKTTSAVVERLEVLGCGLIEGIARIAMDEKQPIGLRVQMYKELAQYVAPLGKALEYKGEMTGSASLVFVIDIGPPPQTDRGIARE